MISLPRSSYSYRPHPAAPALSDAELLELIDAIQRDLGYQPTTTIETGEHFWTQIANEIAQAEWQRVAFIILMILVTVSVIDWISSRLRLAMIGRRAGATA